MHKLQISSWLVAVLAFCMIFGLASTQLYAQPDVSPPAKVTGNPGETITVPLNLTNLGGTAITSFALTFFYPTSLLTFQSTDNAGTLTDGWIQAGGQENVAGQITIGGFNLTQISGDGVLLNVNFEVNAGATGSGPLQLKDFKDGLAGATTTDGVFEVPAEPVVLTHHLLITEFVVTPTEGEFIEIFNPNDVAVDLSNYYITDATFANGGVFYYKIVTGNGGGGGFGDFNARFPAGSSIGPGEHQTLALSGSANFLTTYGVEPTYELYEDDAAPDAIPDMEEATSGSIGGQGGLSNSGEVLVLYYWDGMSDLVQDVDYVVWGDEAKPPLLLRSCSSNCRRQR